MNSDRDYAFAVLAHFQRNPFFYTLNPALLGENRIDDFLFSTLEGFCEHYASTFAFLMRAVGIPSRVIVGYQGAEYNRFENYMMVYQYNAHAWNEVWLEGRAGFGLTPLLRCPRNASKSAWRRHCAMTRHSLKSACFRP